ncbi:hypothetical protein SEA_APIARY_62 [Rhodococcus phage Apiary]|nr:hypothetical protein SEA_BRAXOADDIE_62 [Rhodococcus phage Braxoaddie]WNM64985.1 hypothetical protein SEA_MASELOP_62 [Rhodococcus phage Maselop]WNM67446.1 hypothetical protein SEA_POLYYUKI_62 [Rhodococcus phage Polyyuki]WNM69870.1 hypothetical protein SEA_APIARY_62 [Rhodococcus phage Apiary]
MSDITMCPHPEKRRFGTQESAETCMYAMWRKGRRQRIVCRVYLCRCGAWHMTKKALIHKERGES